MGYVLNTVLSSVLYFDWSVMFLYRSIPGREKESRSVKYMSTSKATNEVTRLLRYQPSLQHLEYRPYSLSII